MHCIYCNKGRHQKQDETAYIYRHNRAGPTRDDSFASSTPRTAHAICSHHAEKVCLSSPMRTASPILGVRSRYGLPMLEADRRWYGSAQG